MICELSSSSTTSSDYQLLVLAAAGDSVKSQKSGLWIWMAGSEGVVDCKMRRGVGAIGGGAFDETAGIDPPDPPWSKTA
jgi:hypothetical protein